MRFVKKLAGVLCLIFLLTACSEVVEETTSQSVLDTSAEESIESTPPETINALEDVNAKTRFSHLQAVPFLEEDRFALRGVAADYVLDYNSFYDKYECDDLFGDGIADAASFVIGESRAENLVGDSVLIFAGDHATAVAGDIGIGTSTLTIQEL